MLGIVPLTSPVRSLEDPTTQRRRHATHLLLLGQLVTLVLGACMAAAPEPTSPAPEPTSPAPVASDPGRESDRSTPPAEEASEGTRGGRSPEDPPPHTPPTPTRTPSATPVRDLPPELGAEYLPYEFIVSFSRGFVADLFSYYDRQRPALDTLFTERGLEEALVRDWRLREVEQGELRFSAEAELASFNEIAEDLKGDPPTFGIELLVDVAAGERIYLGRGGGLLEHVSSRQRRAMAFTMAYDWDLRRWRADGAGAPEVLDTALPTQPPIGPPCPWRANGKTVEQPFDDRPGIWCDGDGRGQRLRKEVVSMSTRYPCERERVAVLHFGWPLGTPQDRAAYLNEGYLEYGRDPEGYALESGWLMEGERFRADVELPEDAVYSGFTNRNIELWISPDELDRAVYVRSGGRFERWPHMGERWGVVDCN